MICGAEDNHPGEAFLVGDKLSVVSFSAGCVDDEMSNSKISAAHGTFFGVSGNSKAPLTCLRRSKMAVKKSTGSMLGASEASSAENW